MNGQIKDFVERLRSETEVAVDVDAPSNPDGDWWIDLEIDGARSTILWKRSLGFGLFAEEAGYGGRPQEIYQAPLEASARVLQLAALRRKDGQTVLLGLKELRHLVGETQTDIAQALGTDQGRISKMEKGRDMRLSTLMNYLAAIGGTLELRAHFPSFEAAIQPVDPLTIKQRIGQDA